MKKLILILVIASFSITGIKAQTPLTEAIDFTATDVHGHTWNLFELLDSGQYVLIDFFYTTCVPCQVAAPKINESYVYFGCNSGQINYFAIDTGDDDAACILFDETYGVEYPTISGIEGGGTQINNDYQISAWPTVILIAPDRTILIQDIWPIATAQTIIDKLESHGIEAHDCPPPIGIEEDMIENGIAISSIFPNPFSNKTNINFSIISSGNILVTVHDMTGREVTVLQDAYMPVGDHKLSWEAGSDVPNGIYFCTISSAQNKMTQKVMLSR